MSQTLKLAAIIVTDIIGYRAHRGNNKQKAFSILNKKRVIQKSLIEQFTGRWIKVLGLGFQINMQHSLQFATIDFENQARGDRYFTLHLADSHALIDEKKMRSIRRAMP